VISNWEVSDRVKTSRAGLWAKKSEKGRSAPKRKDNKKENCLGRQRISGRAQQGGTRYKGRKGGGSNESVVVSSEAHARGRELFRAGGQKNGLPWEKARNFRNRTAGRFTPCRKNRVPGARKRPLIEVSRKSRQREGGILNLGQKKREKTGEIVGTDGSSEKGDESRSGVSCLGRTTKWGEKRP